eukprot:jgi/Botrbrau1/20829/Bobra.0156s0054.1
MTRPQTRSQSKVSESNPSSTETMATPAGGSTASSGAGQSGQTTGGTAASSYAYTMNSSNPKMSTQLKADRTNFRAWREELESCAMQKGAMGALETAMPKTAENAAVKHFILQSVPSMWHDEVKQRGSAFDFIQWMADRCTGGKDREINEKWIKGLKQGMVKGETVQEWCHRVISIAASLEANNHQLSDRQICRYMYKGLPAVLQNDAWAITSAKSDPYNMLETILTAIENLEYQDIPLAESVQVTASAATVMAAAVAAVPAQGGIPGPPQGAGDAPGAGAAPGVGTGAPADGQAPYGPSAHNAGGRGRGSGRGRRPKEELACRFCNGTGHFWRECLELKRLQALRGTMQAASAGPAAWWGTGAPQQQASWWDAGQSRGGPPVSPSHAPDLCPLSSPSSQAGISHHHLLQVLVSLCSFR